LPSTLKALDGEPDEETGLAVDFISMESVPSEVHGRMTLTAPPSAASIEAALFGALGGEVLLVLFVAAELIFFTAPAPATLVPAKILGRGLFLGNQA
jgi:hypothetical protein